MLHHHRPTTTTPPARGSHRKKRTLKSALWAGEWAVGTASFSACGEEESGLGGQLFV